MKKLFLLLLIAPVLGFGQSDWYNHKHKVILMDKDYNVLYQNFSDQIKKSYEAPRNTEYYLRWSSNDNIAILLKKKKSLKKYKSWGKYMPYYFDIASAGKISKLNLQNIKSSTYLPSSSYAFFNDGYLNNVIRFNDKGVFDTQDVFYYHPSPKKTKKITVENIYNTIVFLQSKDAIEKVKTGKLSQGNNPLKIYVKVKQSSEGVVDGVYEETSLDGSTTTNLSYKSGKLISSKIIDNKGNLLPSTEERMDEEKMKSFFKNKGNKLTRLEGIYKLSGGDNEYKISIVKKNDGYEAYILSAFCDQCHWWEEGNIISEIEQTSIKNFYSFKWYTWSCPSSSCDKYKSDQEDDWWERYAREDLKLTYHSFEAVLNDSATIINYENENNSFFVKLFPAGEADIEIKSNKNDDWFGNGSGLIISKSGYIVTNHHVIEDANDIEVEFILNDKAQKFNAEVVQSDKVNDLAIIKIFDINFDGLNNLPYNFKTRSSEVGTKVYAYGYPLALSLMGKEIKITDGIISAKSGFDDDITTYTITAPIQGGNSGGPLFDDKGNFLGINSSGISKEVADNVGYTIKSSYVLNLIDVLPKSIDLPSNTKLESLTLSEQIKEISKYVVLIKVK